MERIITKFVDTRQIGAAFFTVDARLENHQDLVPLKIHTVIFKLYVLLTKQNIISHIGSPESTKPQRHVFKLAVEIVGK